MHNESALFDEYVTSDFPTIAFLLAHGARLVGVRRQGRRVEFTFADKEQCQSLAQKLLIGDDQVSADRYYQAVKKAKKIIHDTP